MGLPVHRDVPLLHHLQQRGLRLRAGAVDLVGEHDVGEHRPAVEVERPGALVVDADAGDVAGEQVGGELDAVPGAGHALRDGACERGLARPREVLQQQVALAEQGDETETHHEGLAEQDLLDVRDEAAEGLLERGGFLRGHSHRCSILSGRIIRARAVRNRSMSTPSYRSCHWPRRRPAGRDTGSPAPRRRRPRTAACPGRRPVRS